MVITFRDQRVTLLFDHTTHEQLCCPECGETRFLYEVVSIRQQRGNLVCREPQCSFAIPLRYVDREMGTTRCVAHAEL